APVAPVDPAARRRRRWWILAINAVVIAAVIGGGAYAAIGVFKLTTPSHVLAAERGQPIATAEAALRADHFQAQVGPAQYDESVPAGQVLSESPAAGTSLKEGSTVVLVPSKGPAPRAVPDLSGVSQATATQRLQQAGFAANVQQQNSESVAAGQVISWTPLGTQPKGTTVTVTVSAGPAPRTIPQLSGQSYAQASAALQQLGLVASENDVYNNDFPSGQVVSTNPGAGGTAAKGSTVTVNVSKGPQIVTVPDVGGMSVDGATRKLTQVGLAVGNIYGPSNTRVFVTDPPAGSQVATGTSVDLYTGR
ncbi:MAG TPA: PASTA domain-containing protein, partial [Acidimicrobiales bacterium]|nr:PASTA domain-containing protein [Acidimicrobiales bacterium]